MRCGIMPAGLPMQESEITLLAREHAARAVNMEPNNVQYRQLLNQLDWNSRRYQSNPYGGGYGAGGQAVERGTCAVISGVQIRCVNVWEGSLFGMHVSEMTAFSGLLLALLSVWHWEV